jgi:hypothetical protein
MLPSHEFQDSIKRMHIFINLFGKKKERI